MNREYGLREGFYPFLSISLLIKGVRLPTAAATRGNMLMTHLEVFMSLEVNSDKNLVWEVDATTGYTTPG